MKLFIAQTIDGFIAGPGDSLDHLDPFNDPDYGYDEHIKSVDAVVLGRTTFDVIYPEHGWTYPPDLPGVVVTSRPLPDGVPENVIGLSDIGRIAKDYGNAFVDGGGKVVRAFCERNLIREARIFTLPILLGDGVRLFPPGNAAIINWRLVDIRKFPDGVVMHHYRV